MNNYLIIDAISYLDADILAKHLEKKEKIRNKAKIKKKVNVLRWSVVAACLFFAIVLSAITIPYIPTKYNLNIVMSVKAERRYSFPTVTYGFIMLIIARLSGKGLNCRVAPKMFS